MINILIVLIVLIGLNRPNRPQGIIFNTRAVGALFHGGAALDMGDGGANA